jgi:hypothetical protein
MHQQLFTIDKCMTYLKTAFNFLTDVGIVIREIARAVAFARTHPTNLQDVD